MNLEIKVNEDILITESIGDIIAFVERLIHRILAGEVDLPVYITIDRPNSNSPPTLGISVSDNMDLGEALG